MNRPIRIGLIAEGEAELGASIPYIKPEDGGKVIERQTEGELHTLIRRELSSIGFDCDFVQRHPTNQESGIYTRRTGHSMTTSSSMGFSFSNRFSYHQNFLPEWICSFCTVFDSCCKSGG
jgi:hypothetical protein